MKNLKDKLNSAWAWIPSLYLIQGLPNVAVVALSVIMYRRMGISNTEIALYTGMLYLPWVIKPLWSPFVDLLKTKRWWIVITQLLLGAGFAGIAFTIPAPFFFQATIAFFWLLAFSSATHDIAADGFYMLALDSNDQAKFVGIRSTFFRCAIIFGQGLLIIFAGFMESVTGLTPVNIKVEASPQHTETTMCIRSIDDFVITPQEGSLHFVTSAETLQMGTFPVNKDSLQLFLAEINRRNQENGFVAVEEARGEAKEKTEDGWWTRRVSTPLGAWIGGTFGPPQVEAVVTDDNLVGNIGVVAVWLSRSPDAGREVVLNTGMNRGKDVALLSGERFVFTEENWNRPAYLVFQLDRRLAAHNVAEFRGLSGNIAFAWSTTFFILAGLLVVAALYHKFALPTPVSDKPSADVSARNIVKEFGHTFYTFFTKKNIGTALFFMLTYRLAESQALAMIIPMMVDAPADGGLGMTTGEVGLAYGTFGVIGLTLGGIVGGIVASRGGLKKWLWPMAMALLLPTGFFVYLAIAQPECFFIISACIFAEQFGYGFGFVAYMLYMMYFSQGENKTAHYAICTGFMALGMMMPRMIAGWLQELLGYDRFFIWLMICSIIPAIAVALLKIDPNYGKANPQPAKAEEGDSKE